MLKPIIISYKISTCELLILYKYLETLRILLTINQKKGLSGLSTQIPDVNLPQHF